MPLDLPVTGDATGYKVTWPAWSTFLAGHDVVNSEVRTVPLQLIVGNATAAASMTVLLQYLYLLNHCILAIGYNPKSFYQSLCAP